MEQIRQNFPKLVECKEQMESHNEQKAQSYSYKSQEWDESRHKALGSKMAELHKTQEELKKAKESTMQAWINSRPLIDELEMLKSGLASAENRCTTPNIISDLESQLETTSISIRSKREEEHKATKMINEINQASDQMHQEIEKFKRDTDEERQAKPRLKQALHLRRQTLQTLQLGLRAVQIEKEALGASAAEALQYINCSEMEKTTIHLTLEDYHALTKRAEDENSLSEWRVSVALEQKLATETSRNKPLAKLNRLYSQKRSGGREIKEEIISGDGHNGDPRIRTGDQVDTGQNMLPQAQNKAIAKPNQRKPQKKRSRSNNSKKFSAKRKPSVLQQIRHFFVRKIKRLFG
ncbi:unnamed protein product [Prunus brigantina]